MSAFGTKIDQDYIPQLPKHKDVILRALNFIAHTVPINKKVTLARTTMIAHFGNYSNERLKLAGLLKHTLLHTVNSTWSKSNSECKTYCRNQSGIEYWTKLIDGTHHLTWREWKNSHPDAGQGDQHQISPAIPQHNIVGGGGVVVWHYTVSLTDYHTDYQALCTIHSAEFKSLNFKMKFQGNRYLHPLHRHSADFKAYIFAQINIPYNYDIENAMPSLLVQFAKKYKPDVLCPLLDEMMIDKKLFRDYIIEHYGLDNKKAKDVICCLFNDGSTSYHPKKSLSIFLQSYNNHQCFVTDKIIIALRGELDLIAQVIRDNADQVLTPLEFPKTKSGSNAKKRGPILSAVYRKLERITMDVILTSNKSNKVKTFREHDGFNCNKIIDVELVQNLVQTKTGYKIRLAFNPNPYVKQLEL